MLPFRPLTVMCNAWFVLIAFVAVAGVIWMFAFTHTLLALPLPPASVFTAVFVVRVIACPLTGMFEVAETTVVPTVSELITTSQLAVAAPPVLVQFGEPMNEPGPLTIAAVPVSSPVSMLPFRPLTVMCSVWLVLTAFVAVAGVIWMFAFT